MTFFEVKIKIDKVLEDGAQKTVTETYAVDALSFTEAESRITAEMQPYIIGEFNVTHEKIAQYNEVVFNDGELFFLVKYNLITLDEKSGKERKNSMYVLFRDMTIDKAKEHAREYMKGSVTDYEIEAIKETKILDVFMEVK
jgi:hypothetical protein